MSKGYRYIWASILGLMTLGTACVGVDMALHAPAAPLAARIFFVCFFTAISLGAGVCSVAIGRGDFP